MPGREEEDLSSSICGESDLLYTGAKLRAGTGV